MKYLKDTFAIAGKDLRVVLKDRGLLVVIFLLPLIFGMMFSTINQSQFNTQSEADPQPKPLLSVYLVNEDAGEYGEQVVNVLKNMGVLELDTLSGDNATAQADQAIADGEKLAAILIPTDFSERIDGYQGAEIKLVVDPGQQEFAGLLKGLLKYATTPAALQGEIRYGIRSLLEESGALKDQPAEIQTAVEAQTFGVIMSQLAEMAERPTIGISPESPAGASTAQSINFFNLLMPGFTVMFAFFLVGAIGESLYLEKDEGTFRRLLSAPISRSTVIAGKMLAYGIIVVLQVVILFGFASLIGGMDVGSSWSGLALVTVALALTVATMGLMIAALSKSGKQADTIGTVLGFVLAGLGGCFMIGTIVPLYLQDSFLGKLSNLTPQAHALHGYYILINQGGSTLDALPQVGILLVFAAVFFMVAALRVRKFYSG